MSLKLTKSERAQEKKGQSLVELAMVLTILLTLLTGVVEFGNLLNQYVTVVDAAREGSRFGSNDDPFIRATNPFTLNENFFTNIDQIVEGTLLTDSSGRATTRAPHAKGALSPIVLRPEMGDDVVVSFFSIYNGVLTRFPSRERGWSFYRDSLGYGSMGYPGQDSAYTTADLQSRIAQGALSAPDTGMVVVEVFYSYSQILRFWGFIGIPDPINVHAYSIMPLSAAEPTQVPSP